MQEPMFNVADVAHFNAARERHRLDNYREDDDVSPFSAKDGWIQGEVHIRMPKEGVRYASEEDAPTFVLKNVWHRPFQEVIRHAFQQKCVRDWHMIPHRLYVVAPPTLHGFSSSSPDNDDNDDGIRVYSEVYNTDAALEEDAAIRARPREAGDADDLEYGVALICMYSDSTRLTNFGSASLWPIYVYFGNQSKYIRGRPTAYAAHHLAYVPSLPDNIQDFYTELHNIAATAAVLTFLRRELMQQILLLLLDDNFMYIYVHGEVIVCGDGIRRREFPRFIFYSADYVEKILLACLKYLARCPCPRCKINKDKIIEMGTHADDCRRNKQRIDDDDVLWRITLARRWIFENGMPLTSKFLDRILGPLSLTPTRSAFSIKLREHNFNHYSMFAPDFMHEVELGVWKSVFTHDMRLLYAAGGDRIQTLNKR
ncbi:hypothetical protein C8T65DRAFT_580236 [Cerioporus squamosus]|nr:hypothetical protein C8T65DRAFT_580236 [Cerioporus squamosus]